MSQADALSERVQRFGEALARDLERINREMAPFVKAVRKVYRDAGAPCGDTDEGMFQWLDELQARRMPSGGAITAKPIRETCETRRRRA